MLSQPSSRRPSSHRLRARRRAGSRNLARRVDRRSYASSCVSSRRVCNESRPQTQAAVTKIATGFHRGQQYSVIALSNGGGTVTERYAYDAYGTPTIADASGTSLTTSAANNRYTYTGREYDEALGLYHYRARMYDSVAGRFCSRDPIGYLSGDQSLYEYSFSDPLGHLDPSGMIPLGPFSPEAWLRAQVEAMVDEAMSQGRGLAEDAEGQARAYVSQVVDWALGQGCSRVSAIGGKNCVSYDMRREFKQGASTKWYLGGTAKVCCTCDCVAISFGGKASGRIKFKKALRVAHLVVGASGSVKGQYTKCKNGNSSLTGTASATATVTARQGVEFFQNIPFFGQAKVEIFGESGYYYNRKYSLPNFQLVNSDWGGFARAVGDFGFGNIHHRFTAQHISNSNSEPDFD